MGVPRIKCKVYTNDRGNNKVYDFDKPRDSVKTKQSVVLFLWVFDFTFHLYTEGYSTTIESPISSLQFLITTYQLLSFNISFAANIPAAPITPPPGCAPLAP